MWLRHWNLIRDPFQSGVGPYVATSSHDDVVNGLLEALTHRESRVELTGVAGTGKSVVFHRVLSMAREPGLRVAKAIAPASLDDLLTQLAQSLRIRSSSPCNSFRMLRDASKLIAAQRGRLLIAIDGLELWGDSRDLNRLGTLRDFGSVFTVRSDELADADQSCLTVELLRLTRSEASAYLGCKLRQVGRDAPAFSTAGLTQLHALSEGIPRRLERLAGQALRVAARHGKSLVDERMIEAIEIDPTGLLALPGRMPIS